MRARWRDSALPGEAGAALAVSVTQRRDPWGQYRGMGNRALVDIRLGKVRVLEGYAFIFSASRHNLQCGYYVDRAIPITGEFP
jgi:hypothetical protein